jgi:P-type E1-E2 ATPase
VGVDGRLSGVLILADELRAGTEAMLRELRAMGIERIVLATGDRHEVAGFVASGLSLDLVRSELTPDQKILVVLAERKNGPVMMIGDGVNDAPALAAADVGVAMGAKGAAASAQAADVVLLVDQLDRISAIKSRGGHADPYRRDRRYRLSAQRWWPHHSGFGASRRAVIGGSTWRSSSTLWALRG